MRGARGVRFRYVDRLYSRAIVFVALVVAGIFAGCSGCDEERRGVNGVYAADPTNDGSARSYGHALYGLPADGLTPQ